MPGPKSAPAGSGGLQQQALDQTTKDAIERAVTEQASSLCKRLGPDGLRRQYDIESNDPVEIAREVATKGYPPYVREAVSQACLSGLREGR